MTPSKWRPSQSTIWPTREELVAAARLRAKGGVGREQNALGKTIRRSRPKAPYSGLPSKRSWPRADQIALGVLNQLVGLADPDRATPTFQPIVERDPGDLAAFARSCAVARSATRFLPRTRSPAGLVRSGLPPSHLAVACIPERQRRLGHRAPRPSARGITDAPSRGAHLLGIRRPRASLRNGATLETIGVVLRHKSMDGAGSVRQGRPHDAGLPRRTVGRAQIMLSASVSRYLAFKRALG